MELTLYERETIILFNEEEKTAQVDTCNPALQRRLLGYSQKHPELFQLVSEDKYGKRFIVPKKYVSVRQPKILSEETKEKYRSNMAEIKFKSQRA